MTNEQIRNHLIKNGVENLKEFGYGNVNSENILTDEVYSMFFKKQLIESKGIKLIDDIIDEILKEIKTI